MMKVQSAALSKLLEIRRDLHTPRVAALIVRELVTAAPVVIDGPFAESKESRAYAASSAGRDATAPARPPRP